MSLMTNYMENKLADFFRGQGLTLPTNWHLALGSAASDSSFTELSGSGYARQAIARSLANFAGTQGAGTTLASSGTSHTTSLNVAVDWGTPLSDWGIASYVGFFDASSSGNCWIAVPISAIQALTGSPSDPVVIAIDGIPLVVGLNTGCSDYLSNKLIDLIFRGQAFTWPSSTWAALFSVAPTNAGGGTEFSLGGYARVEIVSSLTAWSATNAPGSTSPSGGTSGIISNNSAVTYPTPSSPQGTAVAEALMDASTSGNMLFHNLLDSALVVNATAPTHSAGTIEIEIA